MKEKMLKVEEVAVLVGVSAKTINVWYAWAKKHPDEEMAKYQIEREMLNIEWKIVPHGNIGTANKDDNANKAVMLYQMLMSNPLVASEPMHIRRLTFDLLQAMERKDIDSYIGSEEELHQAMQQAEQKMMEQQQMQSMQPLQQPQEQMGGQQIGG